MARAPETSPTYSNRIGFAEFIVVCAVFSQGLPWALSLLDGLDALGEPSTELRNSSLSFSQSVREIAPSFGHIIQLYLHRGH